jgi:uncharacterized protein YecE (DUF72 family)
MAPSSTGKVKKAPSIWIGCSGWAYPSWRPLFYPAKTPLKKLLEAYADRLNSVEVNYTFRSLPTPTNVEGWLRATPEAFRFSFKAPQRITHFSRLRSCGPLLDQFAESIKPVLAAGRFGVVLFQLPPNFAADAVLLDGFLADAVQAFAREADVPMRMAFEFRHPSWFRNQTYAVLEQHGAALCVAESDELATPDVLTAPFACYRLRRSDYSQAALDTVRAMLQQRATRGEVFAYFKHEEEPDGPLRAAAVLAGLRG